FPRPLRITTVVNQLANQCSYKRSYDKTQRNRSETPDNQPDIGSPNAIFTAAKAFRSLYRNHIIENNNNQCKHKCDAQNPIVKINASSGVQNQQTNPAERRSGQSRQKTSGNSCQNE